MGAWTGELARAAYTSWTYLMDRGAGQGHTYLYSLHNYCSLAELPSSVVSFLNLQKSES